MTGALMICINWTPKMTGYVQLFMISCGGAGYIDIKYTAETGSDDMLSVNMIQYAVMFITQSSVR